jgi:ADP-ribosyl-[dinitrogen reductase] hydrolase
MRCAPYAVAFAYDPTRLETVSRQSSAITYADPRCTAGCAVLNATLAAVLVGAADGPEALTLARERVDDVPDEVGTALDDVPLARERCRTTAYVVDTLVTSLSVGLTADSAEDGIVEAVNLGGDTDTIGAVTGAVVGARFGASSLPERWLSVLDRADELRDLGARLAALDPDVAEAMQRVKIPFVDVYDSHPLTLEFRFFRLTPDEVTGQREAEAGD